MVSIPEVIAGLRAAFDTALDGEAVSVLTGLQAGYTTGDLLGVAVAQPEAPAVSVTGTDDTLSGSSERVVTVTCSMSCADGGTDPATTLARAGRYWLLLVAQLEAEPDLGLDDVVDTQMGSSESWLIGPDRDGGGSTVFVDFRVLVTI